VKKQIEADHRDPGERGRGDGPRDAGLDDDVGHGDTPPRGMASLGGGQPVDKGRMSLRSDCHPRATSGSMAFAG